MSFIIAIDGPTSAGKTTMASILAQKLNFINIQTGAMYRCIAYEMLKQGIGLNEEEKINNLLNTIQIEFKNQESGNQIVLLNGEDVSSDIRSKDVTNYTSDVASIKEVRKKLLEFQRRMAEKRNVVIEGRDTGTIVFPNANVKFYLSANPTIRAKRKCEELAKNGFQANFLEILKDMYKWDYDAINREEGALKKAPGSISIDTSNLSVNQLEEMMMKEINKKFKEKVHLYEGGWEHE